MKSKEKEKTAPEPTPDTILNLVAVAAGRCQFNGCNTPLFRSVLTTKVLKKQNVAHIIGASKHGPRGDDTMPLSERGKIHNLMLTCPTCHSEVDNKKLVKKYPKELLLAMKKEHEDRIATVTAASPKHKTCVIRTMARIGEEDVYVGDNEILDAVLPYYPIDAQHIDLDFRGFTDAANLLHYSRMADEIETRIRDAYWKKLKEIQHVSVFAIGPIPLLIKLGHSLSNKIPTSIFQRHRSPENWMWPTEGYVADFDIRKLKDGSDNKKVAVLLSLSGFVQHEHIPKEVMANYHVYEIFLMNEKPNPMFLTHPDTLERFKKAYKNLIATLQSDHRGLKEISLFPAIPAPVAILCGRELLKKVHPSLVVYDMDKKSGGFYQTLTVN